MKHKSHRMHPNSLKNLEKGVPFTPETAPAAASGITRQFCSARKTNTARASPSQPERE